MLPAAEKEGNEAVEQRRLKDTVLRCTVTKVLAMLFGLVKDPRILNSGMIVCKTCFKIRADTRAVWCRTDGCQAACVIRCCSVAEFIDP
jgi:hypothetical protein